MFEAISEMDSVVEDEAPVFSKKAEHLAGIVPVASDNITKHNFPWDELLLPVENEVSAIQKAVIDAAAIGCDTVWIVCPIHLQPLVRLHMGEYVRDFYARTDLSKKEARIALARHAVAERPVTHRKIIPIYYVAYPASENTRAKSLAWVALYGARVVRKISKKFSARVVPKKYWISFPFAMYQSRDLFILRNAARDASRNVFLAYDAETVKDGKYLGFTLRYGDVGFLIEKATHTILERYKEHRRQSNAGLKESYEVFAGRDKNLLSLEEVFYPLTIDPTSDIVIELGWYYQVDNWREYVRYLGQTKHEKLRLTYKNILPKRRWLNRLSDHKRFEEQYKEYYDEYIRGLEYERAKQQQS